MNASKKRAFSAGVAGSRAPFGRCRSVFATTPAHQIAPMIADSGALRDDRIMKWKTRAYGTIVADLALDVATGAHRSRVTVVMRRRAWLWSDWDSDGEARPNPIM